MAGFFALAMTTAPTLAEAQVGSRCATLEAAVLTIPVGAANLGLGIASLAGTRRGVGIAAILTGVAGLITSGLALYLIYPSTLAGCDPTDKIIMGSIGLALGGFALGAGIYRVVESKKRTEFTWLPFLSPMLDPRQKNPTVTGVAGGLTLVWN